MPRLASITSQSLTAINVSTLIDLVGSYGTASLLSSSNSNSTGNTFYQGETATVQITGTYSGDPLAHALDLFWSINATTDDFQAVSGTAVVSSTTDNGNGTFDVAYQAEITVATSIVNPDTYTLIFREGAADGTLVGSYAFTIETYVPAGIWLDDNSDPVTVASIVSPVAMQINGVFAVNPATPFTIQGISSGAITTITNISANTGTLLEIEDSGNSNSFSIGENLEII